MEERRWHCQDEPLRALLDRSGDARQRGQWNVALAIMLDGSSRRILDPPAPHCGFLERKPASAGIRDHAAGTLAVDHRVKNENIERGLLCLDLREQHVRVPIAGGERAAVERGCAGSASEQHAVRHQQRAAVSAKARAGGR